MVGCWRDCFNAFPIFCGHLPSCFANKNCDKVPNLWMGKRGTLRLWPLRARFMPGFFFWIILSTHWIRICQPWWHLVQRKDYMYSQTHITCKFNEIFVKIVNVDFTPLNSFSPRPWHVRHNSLEPSVFCFLEKSVQLLSVGLAMVLFEPLMNLMQPKCEISFWHAVFWMFALYLPRNVCNNMCIFFMDTWPEYISFMQQKHTHRNCSNTCSKSSPEGCSGLRNHRNKRTYLEHYMHKRPIPMERNLSSISGLNQKPTVLNKTHGHVSSKCVYIKLISHKMHGMR